MHADEGPWWVQLSAGFRIEKQKTLLLYFLTANVQLRFQCGVCEGQIKGRRAANAAEQFAENVCEIGVRFNKSSVSQLHSVTGRLLVKIFHSTPFLILQLGECNETVYLGRCSFLFCSGGVVGRERKDENFQQPIKLSGFN